MTRRDDLATPFDAYLRDLRPVTEKAIAEAAEHRARLDAVEKERDMAKEGWTEAQDLIRVARLQYSEEKARAALAAFDKGGKDE